jgi:hypothetical protein
MVTDSMLQKMEEEGYQGISKWFQEQKNSDVSNVFLKKKDGIYL